ncbi:hypothetical protein GCM10010232_48390 [Streptomyces amakusaensis]
MCSMKPPPSGSDNSASPQNRVNCAATIDSWPQGEIPGTGVSVFYLVAGSGRDEYGTR